MRRSCRQWLITWRWHKTSLIQGTGLGTQKGKSQLLVSEIFYIPTHINLLYHCWRVSVTLKPTDLALKWQSGVVNMRRMLLKPIKYDSWHVTVALMSLHVAFYLRGVSFSRCFTRCIDWVQLLWSGSRGGEVFAGAQESSFEEAANTVARFCLEYFLLASFNWSVITPTTSKSSYKCLQVSVANTILLFGQYRSYTLSALLWMQIWWRNQFQKQGDSINSAFLESS